MPHEIFNDLNVHIPYPDVFPESFKTYFKSVDFMQFRNLDHFKFVVSKLKQREADKCGMDYYTALMKLMKSEGDFPKEEQVLIRDKVRQNLHKRGLITEEVYEEYKYATEGTQVGVDPAKYAAGEPDCVITPTHQYVDYFYELYISISYSCYVEDSAIREECAKLLATIEELERQHIYIKITLVLPIETVAFDSEKSHNYFACVPLFSHKEPKNVNVMSSVVNERLLRKFFFAVLENFYEEDLADNYGTAVDLNGAFTLGNEFDEVEFFERVLEAVGLA